MYNSTGFTRNEITDLCAMIRSEELEPGINHWPPILGLFRSVTVTLTYMRRNRVQAELAEVSIQPSPFELRWVIAGHVSAAGVVLGPWLCVACGMIGDCDRCAAVGGSA